MEDEDTVATFSFLFELRAVSGDCVVVVSLSFFQLSEADRGDPSLMETGPLTDQGGMKEGGPCSRTGDPMKSQVQQESPLLQKDPQMRSLTFM